MDDDRNWSPLRRKPGNLIGVQLALEQIVTKKYGAGFVTEWTPAILRGEFGMQMIGGVRTAAFEDARTQVETLLATNKKARLYRVAKREPNAPVLGPRVIEFYASGVWRSSDRAKVFSRRLILDREEDPFGRWFYALDKADLRPLLRKPVHKKKGRPPALYWAKAEKAAMSWLDQNGYPQSGDGGQAALERHVTEILSRDDIHPGESTVRVHVSQWILNYKQSLRE